jgi:DNA repair photolyase
MCSGWTCGSIEIGQGHNLRRSESGAFVEFENRRSAVLSNSDLPCLRDVATVNVSLGCAHACVYCYARGYSTYPGDGRVVVYSNLLEKLEGELLRKRKPVSRVYFSPSCDCFQPLRAVLDVTYEVMQLLLKRGIPVAFLTKGAIPERFMDLFQAKPHLVHAQVGITTLDQTVARAIEPNAATPKTRVRNIKQLTRLGIHTMARLDPLIPCLTDMDASLSQLFESISHAGAKSVVVNYLFLRSALSGKMLSVLRQVMGSVDDLCSLLSQGTDMAMYQDRSLIRVLSTEYRRVNYDRIRQLAERYGLQVHVCGCKNFDITNERCLIAGPSPRTLFDWGSRFLP